jgi:hypothetical protein
MISIQGYSGEELARGIPVKLAAGEQLRIKVSEQ